MAEPTLPSRRKRWKRAGRRGASNVSASIDVLVNNAGIYGPMGPHRRGSIGNDWVRCDLHQSHGHRSTRAERPCSLICHRAPGRRQDHQHFGWRRDQSAAGHQRLCGREGRGRPLHRDHGAGGQRQAGHRLNAIAPGHAEYAAHGSTDRCGSREGHRRPARNG